MSVTTEKVKEFEDEAVNNFREYLRIPSVHPDVNYDPCIEFLKKQAKALNLPIKVVEVAPKNPVAILTWIGSQPELPSILLNSHMDVVPVFKDKWTRKPFDAEMDENGNIFGRGSQDDKCVGIHYLEAIRRLKKQGITLKRTLHISFMPDEERGGKNGMKKFVETKDFKDLNIGMSFDEGMTSSTEQFFVLYDERPIWQIIFRVSGNPGHGSLLKDNTAGEKVEKLLTRIYNFRNEQSKKLKENPDLTLGDVTSINLTIMRGGIQPNVIPPEFLLYVDCRIAVTQDLQKWEDTLKKWCEESGSGITIEYEQKNPQVLSTNLDSSNIYWTAFKEATDELGLKIRPLVCPGGTDNRFIRQKGIFAIGFSAVNQTPTRLHGNDEFLNKNVFLKGIDIYCKILQKVANLGPITNK